MLSSSELPTLLVPAPTWRQRGLRLLGELVLIGMGYASYAWVRGHVGAVTSASDRARAVRNAERLVRVERWFGLFRERGIQRALLHVPWLMRALDSFWSYGYLVVTSAVILWLLTRHLDRFGPLRTAFFVTTIVAVGIFALAPTVPPRLLPSSYGIIDTWSKVGGLAARKPPRIEHISDPYASIPSLHVAWSVWCAVCVTKIVGRRWIRVAVWLYPALTVLAVVATGNHFFLDCAAGALLMGLAIRYLPALDVPLAWMWGQVLNLRDRRIGLSDGDIAQVLSDSQELD
jgi:hypothetical protein